MAKQGNDLDKAFEELEQNFGENRVIRREMIASLQKALANPEMAPSPYDKAMAIQAKVSVYKTLDDLLKSDEDITMKKLRMKLARKDSETNGMVGATIVETLKAFRANGLDMGGDSKKDVADAQGAIEQRAAKIAESGDDKEAKALTITEGELEECTKSVDAAERPEDDPVEE